MTLKEVCNKIQKTMNEIIQHECKVKARALEEGLKVLNEKQKIEAIENIRIETSFELGAMVKQHYKIYDAIVRWENNKDFMWESSLIEVLTFDERMKYRNCPSNDYSLEKYKEQSDIYDKKLPYLSFIIKAMVLLKFKYSIDHLEFLYVKRKEESKLAIRNTCYSDQTISETQNKNKVENPFEVKLDDKQIEILTECINEAHLFATTITTDILVKLFTCKLQTPLKSRNNRSIAYLFFRLEGKYITYEWAAVIDNNKLILASKKDGYLNSSDLYEAKSKVLEKTSSFKTIIDKYIEQLKKH